MSNRNAIVALALLAIAIGCVVVVAVRWYGGDTTPIEAARNAAAPAPGEEPAVNDTTTATAAGTAIADEAPPPWMQGDEAPQQAAAAGNADDALRQQQLQELDASVRAIVATSRAGAAERNRHLREALDTLEAMDDPAVKAQVDLDAVRDNLEISVRMQALAAQLQEIAARPRSPERSAALAATSAQMEALQAQLHPDVRGPGSTLPPIGATPGAATRR